MILVFDHNPGGVWRERERGNGFQLAYGKDKIKQHHFGKYVEMYTCLVNKFFKNTCLVINSITKVVFVSSQRRFYKIKKVR